MELINEMGRRYDDTDPFKIAILFIGSFYYFQIDDDPIEKLFRIDKETAEIFDFKLDGLPLRRYSVRQTASDFEDVLPPGPVGSRFLRIKIIKHYPGCTRCVWGSKSIR